MSTAGARPWLVVTFAPGGVNDGIGDFSEHLAAALAVHRPTSRFVRREQWTELHAIDPASVGGVVVQYFPQAFLRGDFRHLIRWLARARSAGAVLAVTVHEFWPPANGTFRRAIGRLLFRRMLRALCRVCHHVVITRASARHDLAEAVHRPAVVIPAGAGVLAPGERAPLPGEPVAKAAPTRVVMFGQPAAMDAAVVAGLSRWLRAAPDRSLEWFARSADEMRAAWPAFGADVHAPVTFSGGLPASEVSLRLSAATLGVSPNVNGASTRRATFAALLGHGLPVVATSGSNTDDELVAAAPCVFAPEGDADAFVAALDALAARPAEQAAVGARARAFYEASLSWPRIGAAYANLLTDTSEKT